MTPTLAEALFDQFAERRRKSVAKGWAEPPEWVFCSETGSAPDPRNVERIWQRVRRKAQKQGVRPLKDIKLMKEDPEGVEKSAQDVKARYAAIFKV